MNKISFATGVKYSTIIAGITALSFVFLTKDSFSKWKEKSYYPVVAKHDQSIALLQEQERVYQQNHKDIKNMIEKLLNMSCPTDKL